MKIPHRPARASIAVSSTKFALREVKKERRRTINKKHDFFFFFFFSPYLL